MQEKKRQTLHKDGETVCLRTQAHVLAHIYATFIAGVLGNGYKDVWMSL